MAEMVRLPMACACGEQRKARLDALVAGRTATHLLHELCWDHCYMVDHIGVDMWCGVVIKSMWDDEVFDEDDIPERFRGMPPIRIEFDVLEHGLACLIEHLQALNPESEVAET